MCKINAATVLYALAGLLQHAIICSPWIRHWEATSVLWCGFMQSSSERSDRSVRFEPNLRSERVRYVSERETNVQALERLICLKSL